MTGASQLFLERFGHPPIRRVRAPGRLELIGNHTDYNEGLVMALAIDRHIEITAAPTKDGRITLISSAFPESDTGFAHTLNRNPAAPWADYPKGVLDQLRRRNVHFKGFNAAIHSTIPLGAGMSSSAAIEVATALIVRELYPFTLQPHGLGDPPLRDAEGRLPALTPPERLELAKLCQAAENEFIGVHCGLLDQVSSLFGKAFHAIEIDCQSLRIEMVPMIGEIAIVVCHSGVKHDLIDGEYNARRSACESAARKLGARSLRSVEPRYLSAHRKDLPQLEYDAAYHIVGEIQRVVYGARALRSGDLEQFGQFMFQSHQSSRDFFRNSCPELDLLVEIARAHPACLGARLTGGGFGGATINLVRREGAENFRQVVATEYKRRANRTTDPLLCQIVDGAQ